MRDAEALERAGVKVHYVCHEHMIHHFYAMGGAIPYARTALRAMGADIKAVFGNHSLNVVFGQPSGKSTINGAPIPQNSAPFSGRTTVFTPKWSPLTNDGGPPP